MWLALLPLAQAADVAIVTPGTHDDDAAVAVVRDGDRWLALEPAGKGWRLVETPVRVTKRVPTSEFDATAAYYDVAAERASDGAILLIRSEALRPGPVEAFEARPTFDAPAVYAANDGATVTIGLFGRAEPHPSGYANPLWRDVTVQISAGRGEPWEVVLGPVSHNESPPSVLWVGDLDRDGKIDLLTVTPGEGGGSTTELWLSSSAAPGRALGLAARSVNAGC